MHQPDRNESVPRVVRTWSDALAILRSPAFENAGFDGAEQIMGATLPSLSGDEHAGRRRLELPLFRPEELDKHEHESLPSVLTLLRDHLVEVNGSDSDVHVDLVWWAQMVMTRLVTEIIGIDDVDVAGTERLYRIQRRFAEIASPGASPKARARIAEAIDAQEELRCDFFQPSIDRRRTLAGEGRLGELQDLLSILVREGYDDDLALREVNPYLVGARTPGRSTVQTLLNLDQWFAAHPEDRELRFDPAFLLRASAETIRLWPPAMILRRALQDVTVGGVAYRRGDLLTIDQSAANGDLDAFGAEAAEFNPRRDLGPQRFATSFGSGPHLCIGRPLTIRDRTQTGQSSSFGVQIRMLEWLYRVGVQLDPANPPEWRADARYVYGTEEPVLEHEVLIRCPAILTRI